MRLLLKPTNFMRMIIFIGVSVNNGLHFCVRENYVTYILTFSLL
ncbi:hypothetical protein EMIT019CA3_70148 [Bacillus pseudomycoides]